MYAEARELLESRPIDQLENILAKEVEQLAFLQQEYVHLDFGTTPTLREVEESFEQIKDQVHELCWLTKKECDLRYIPVAPKEPIFGPVSKSAFAVAGAISGVFYLISPFVGAGCAVVTTACGVKWYRSTKDWNEFFHACKSRNYYSKDTITILHQPSTDIAQTLGHEYAHHLQIHSGNARFESVVHREGHAIAVQKRIAEREFQEKGNLAALYSIHDRTVGEIRTVYKWLCNSIGARPRKEFFSIPSTHDDKELLGDLFGEEGTPGKHALGNTVYALRGYPTL